MNTVIPERSCHPRLRGTVIPAKAGISLFKGINHEIPAFAGMTVSFGDDNFWEIKPQLSLT